MPKVAITMLLEFTKDEKRAGWWDALIGPGKAIDTNKFYVVCPNNIGGCHGSTGPTSINQETGQIYGPDFPMITVKDWVKCSSFVIRPSWEIKNGMQLLEAVWGNASFRMVMHIP